MSRITPAHGGNVERLAREAGVSVNSLLDFSANINPLGFPSWLRAVTAATLSDLLHYPDPDCTDLVKAAAAHYCIREEEVLAGNGSAELMALLPSALNPKRAVVVQPGYADYARSCRAAGIEVVDFVLQESNEFILDFTLLKKQLRAGDLIFIGTPNNPTGRIVPSVLLRQFVLEHPDCTFVIDEAFGDFVEGFVSLTRNRPPNVIVLLSLTKMFGIPGLRLGLGAADPRVVERVRTLQPPWSVNTLAQKVGVAALADTEFVKHSRSFVVTERAWLIDLLSSISCLKIFLAETNFLLVKLLPNASVQAPELAARLLARGIAIRVCNNFVGLDDSFFRIAVRTRAENQQIVAALQECLANGESKKLSSSKTYVKPRARTIMLQGTSSNAGKSVLTAALCRIFLEDGYRVAPFKSQNMALNSYVTRDGLEMGRAQVVQAQAAKIDPDVRMNPVLLKPNSDTGSQVIVQGKPIGNMVVEEYIRYKPQLWQTICDSFDSLASEYDIVVLEGAGSPGEVNLKRHDIVNMKMAQYAQSPVLLVGDIDRGGLFASFVGTMEVLEEWERSLIAGFVVNRFRGRKELLDDAFQYVAQHVRRPVFGTVPYLRNLGLPEEDSVSFKEAKSDELHSSKKQLDIALIDLPHISNFTDFDALKMESDVNLRVVRSVQELGSPHAVILPGSKNVMGDMAYLRREGFAARLVQLHERSDLVLIGVCGGFQMLGSVIRDPHHIESSADTVEGLGFLPLTTVLEAQKTLRQATARHRPSGELVKGYEIHHGESSSQDLDPVVVRDDDCVIGVGKNGVWGTYLHGIFDNDRFRRWFLNDLRSRIGLEPLSSGGAIYDTEAAFARLAQVVRESLDLKKIYQAMKLT